MNPEIIGQKPASKSKISSIKDILERNRLDFEDHPAKDLFTKSDNNKAKEKEQMEEILKVIPGRFEQLEKSMKKNAIWRNVSLGAIILGIGFLIFRPAAETAPKATVVESQSPQKKVLETPKNEIVAVKYINMRTLPSTSGSKILVVPPNQALIVIESRNDWKFVSYYDYVRKKTVKGWVYFSDDGFISPKKS